MECDSSISDLCKICSQKCDPYENPSLLCKGDCQRKIHIRCLKRGSPPSNLIGDVFYDLYCITCSDSNDEIFIRQKLSWLVTVLLTLYNLREKSSGISRRGYFHWKINISTFINNNWDILFTKTVKKKKNWTGTISGTLSHYCSLFFKSGTSDLGEQGWWKLIDSDPPEVLVEKYNKVLKLKKEHQAKLKAKAVDSPKSESNYSNDEGNSSEAESSKTKEVKPIANTKYITKSSFKTSKSLSPTEEFADFLDLDIDMPNIDIDFPSLKLNKSGIEDLPFQNELPNVFMADCFEQELAINVEEEEPFEEINVSDMPSIDSYQEQCETICNTDESNEQKENNENDKGNDLPVPPPSLFTESTPRPWPWDESIKLNPDDIRPLMSEREEEFLLQKIEKHKHLLETAPPTVKRLYRKLAVRKLKRQYGLLILNIDRFGKDLELKNSLIKKKGNVVLDRFISEDVSIFFEQRLQGHCEPTSVHSPYTNRLLKPYIRRDTSSRPLWLRVMNELLVKVNRKKPGWNLPPTAPIDYSYIKPQHIPAINSLCTQFFWPGVDLTECLQYPDFTCVVLYKKVVIGFSIMIPDVGYNEAYISFLLVRPEWRKAGIGTFMLYHLIQTCMGKDITLHVSVTNPALILYQKFGFKQEELVQDFYDKYILPSSKESKHALFLRLSR